MDRAERRKRTNRIARRRVQQCLDNGCTPETQREKWMYVFEPGYWKKVRLEKSSPGAGNHYRRSFKQRKYDLQGE